MTALYQQNCELYCMYSIWKVHTNMVFIFITASGFQWHKLDLLIKTVGYNFSSITIRILWFPFTSPQFPSLYSHTKGRNVPGFRIFYHTNKFWPTNRKPAVFVTNSGLLNFYILFSSPVKDESCRYSTTCVPMEGGGDCCYDGWCSSFRLPKATVRISTEWIIASRL